MTARILDGPGAGFAHMRSALELWNAHEESTDAKDRSWPFPVAQESAAHELWDDAVLQQIATETVRRARDAGALAVLAARARLSRRRACLYGRIRHRRQGFSKRSTPSPCRSATRRVKYHSLNLAAWRGVQTEAVDLIACGRSGGRREGRRPTGRPDQAALGDPVQRSRSLRRGPGSRA